ncbi:hypothetical protein [Methylomonas sp. TEB]|uniref:hypothetical protein n=1 Tax=Methylomonas sp. TEB TaxID=3398229 RepID=UPI0039F52357
MEESKRVKKLRREVIAALPTFPNNRETKDLLDGMFLGNLLIHYLNWVIRYVAIKPRKVLIEPAVMSDRRWCDLKHQVYALLEKVRDGDNLNPHLSTLPQTRGYMPSTSETEHGVDRWVDKDFLLNTMGFHHFHLGMKSERNGYVERTNELVFANVSREMFTLMGIFDHSVFEFTDKSMSDERKRLWAMFDSYITRGAPSGTVVLATQIAMSGHSVHVVETAGEYSRIIYQIDSKLDSMEYVRDLYASNNLATPKKLKFEWMLNFSDLLLLEKHNNHFFVMHRGFN